MIAALLAFLLASVPVIAGPAPLRTALLAWETVPAREDVRRVAADLVALAQAELSTEPGLAWVERAELDKLLAEADISASGRLDPRASLRVGKLARAQLLVTGRLEASDQGASTLTLEALDLERGDLLAASRTTLPSRPHKHHRMRDEDRAVAVSALRSLLSEAAARHRELAAKPSVALLFLANTGPSSRLDATGARLDETLRDSATRAGVRMLNFPRTRDADAEQDLVLLGLSEADDQAWRGVADLYVWGEYKELPADGLVFEDTPVEASLTLWDGATVPRVETWSGPAARFPEAERKFARALAEAARPAAATDADARSAAAKLLFDRASALEKANGQSFNSPDFWTSALGRNFQRHRVHLLQTAAFLEPANADVRRSLFAARWDSRAIPAKLPVEEIWRQYADRRAVTEHFSDPRKGLGGATYQRSLRANDLEHIIETLAKNLHGENRLRHAEIRHAARLWVKELEELHAWSKDRPETAREFESARRSRADYLIGLGNGPYLSSDIGLGVVREMLDGSWPVLAPAFKDWFDQSPEFARNTAERYVTIYRAFGEEDAAYARLLAALAVESPKPAEPASAPTRASRTRYVAATESESDPAPSNPEWTPPPPASAPSELGVSLPLTPRPLHRWRDAPRSRADAIRATSKTQDFGTVLLQPDHVRLLGFDGRRLWIDGLISPEAGADRSNAAPRRVALLAPDTREFTEIGPLLPGSSRMVGVGFASDTPFLATAFDGLVRLGAEPGKTESITPDAGLPSLKLAALTAYEGGVAVAAARPELGVARLDLATGRWLNLAVPEAPTPNQAGGPAAFQGPGETVPQPLLAGLGPWILVARDSVHLFDTRTDAWSPAIEKLHDARRAFLADPDLPRRRREAMSEIMAARRQGDTATVARLGESITPPSGWSSYAPSALLADEKVFWIGSEAGLVRFDPARPPSEAHIEKSPPILALASTGTWLWAAFAPEEDAGPHGGATNAQPAGRPRHALGYGRREPPEWRRSRIGLYDKIARRWIGSVEVTGGITSLAAAPGRLWAAGSTLLEFDTRSVAPVGATRDGGPVRDPGARWAGLAPFPLQHAVERGDLDDLRRLLAAGEAVDAAGSEGWTALHVAAQTGNAEAVSALLAADADLQAFTRDGRSALGLAAARGDIALVRRLLAAGADPNRQRRPRLALFPNFTANTTFPVTAPAQPDAGSVEALAEGRARVRWTSPPGNQDGFVIYRNDTPPAAEDRYSRGPRWDRYDADYAYLGWIWGTARADVREWIDDIPRPPGTTSTYTVVAVNAFDRHGPKEPRPAGSITAPPNETAPPDRTFETHHLALDRPPLLLAATEGRAEIVATLLAAGANPAGADAGGGTALLAAVQNGRLDIAELLIAAGAPLDAVAATGSRLPDRLFLSGGNPRSPTNSDAHTPLSLAYSLHQNEALFRRLLQAGADPQLGPEGALAPQAAARGRETDMELLLAAGPHPFVTNIHRQTVFTAALSAGRPQLAARLRERAFDLQHPAWPDRRIVDLEALAFHAAVFRQDLETIEWLRNRGASLEGRRNDDTLETALTCNLPAPFIRALIAAGAEPKHVSADLVAKITDPDIRAALSDASASTSPSAPAKPANILLPFPRVGGSNRFHGPHSEGLYRVVPDAGAATPAQRDGLRTAAIAGNLADLRATLADGSPVDAADDKGWTALFHALHARRPDVARALIDAGASLNRLTKHGSSPLVFAVDLGDRALIDEMLDLGADPNLVHSNSASPLTLALQKDLGLARHLIRRGADIRFAIGIGGLADDAPPLFLAARGGNLPAVRLLVEEGASPTLALWRGRAGREALPGLTALPFAAASNDLPTLEYFLALGLDPAWENAYGDNALDWALASKADRTAAKLRVLGVKTRVERGLPAHEH